MNPLHITLSTSISPPRSPPGIAFRTSTSKRRAARALTQRIWRETSPPQKNDGPVSRYAFVFYSFNVLADSYSVADVIIPSLKTSLTFEIVGPDYCFSADTALAQEILDLVQQASHYRESAFCSEWSLPYPCLIRALWDGCQVSPWICVVSCRPFREKADSGIRSGQLKKGYLYLTFLMLQYFRANIQPAEQMRLQRL